MGVDKQKFINPLFKIFWKRRGCGEGRAFLQKRFSLPTKNFLSK